MVRIERMFNNLKQRNGGFQYKFDHERVTKEDPKRVLEEQYGGVEETNPGFNNTPFKFTKYSNAYTLVYIREVDKEKVICNVDEKDIAVALDILKFHTRTVPGVIEANHVDVDSFARGVSLVSLLGDKSDGDRKIEDLKLLYRAYVTNALASGHMQDNKANGHCIQISIFG
ncbi:ubiquitin-specific protease [Trifolium repens]|nr:ubiquitin-specific protease [Trifolium repens]